MYAMWVCLKIRCQKIRLVRQSSCSIIFPIKMTSPIRENHIFTYRKPSRIAVHLHLLAFSVIIKALAKKTGRFQPHFQTHVVIGWYKNRGKKTQTSVATLATLDFDLGPLKMNSFCFFLGSTHYSNV